ncbi:hypothetical protein BAL199_16778 [alpha proteobacterium BAL199]|jgi:hypothetical protein|nr:hypothetical protein BAL199_16778 [alpha proteobacterium BAL199]
MMMIARLIVAVLALSGPSAIADDAGLDWRPVSAKDSKVRITLPEAAAHTTYFKAQRADYAANFYIARIPTSAHRLDQVSLLYAELAPDRFFPTEYDVREILTWKNVQAVGARETGNFTVVARPSVYDVVTFVIDAGVQCAAFAVTWGSHGSETAGAGSRRILGYGCENPGTPLNRDRIKQSLDSLEIDD